MVVVTRLLRWEQLEYLSLLRLGKHEVLPTPECGWVSAQPLELLWMSPTTARQPLASLRT